MQASNVSQPERVAPAGISSLVEKRLLPMLWRKVGRLPVRVVLGNRGAISPPDIAPRFTLWVRDLRTLADLALDPEIGFGDAWSDGRLRLTGDLVAFLEAVYQSMEAASRGTDWYVRLFSKWLDSRQANTLEGSRKNIYSHYDLGNDFYRMWLDPRLVYTCAYFPETSVTLESAQTAKMDYICRKLRLQRGENVVEAGCGWGALALHMARNYGVRVKAFNISREQLRHARECAREENLDHLVEFIEDDYRNASGKFDAFVSVGMLEHVGRENYSQLGSVIHRLIGQGGRGLLHFIGRREPGEFSRWIRKRIFPGAHAPTLRDAMQVLEPFGYFVRDVEDLRSHYAKTLGHWLHQFEKASEEVTAMYGAEFERAWRLYLAGSIAGFTVGTLQLFQIVFSGAGFESMPSTRADLYGGQGESEWTPATS